MPSEIGVQKLVKSAREVVSIIRAESKKNNKLTKGYIRPHQVGDKTYYYYCRGSDKEIYLGSAEAILKLKRGER